MDSSARSMRIRRRFSITGRIADCTTGSGSTVIGGGLPLSPRPRVSGPTGFFKDSAPAPDCARREGAGLWVEVPEMISTCPLI